MAAAADASVYRPVEIDSSQCDTLKAAKLLTPLVDCGTDGKWKADRSAPGDGVKRAGFVCNKHEACEVKLLIRQSGGAYSFLVKGSHTDVLSPCRSQKELWPLVGGTGVRTLVGEDGRKAGRNCCSYD